MKKNSVNALNYTEKQFSIIIKFQIDNASDRKWLKDEKANLESSHERGHLNNAIFH